MSEVLDDLCCGELLYLSVYHSNTQPVVFNNIYAMSVCEYECYVNSRTLCIQTRHLSSDAFISFVR